jgi:hypothetical protein
MDVTRKHLKPCRAAIAAAAFALLGGCLVPDNAYLMQLNRTGKWKEAARVGQEMLAHRSTFTHSEICETYFHVIYAETRMKNSDEAVTLMKEYDSFRVAEAIDPKLLWLGREMARLKVELGMLDDVQRTLVSAMEENGKGDYTLARDLCDAVLAMRAANEIQKATAHFVAAVCSIRLKDVDAADSHLTAFDALKSSLPADHQALAEEAFARQGLLELKESPSR